MSVAHAWTARQEGVNVPAVVAVMGLHLVAALVWQPSQASPPTEVVLKAVIMPTVQPREEVRPPEPPTPVRRMQAQRPSTQARMQPAAAEFSEAQAESAPAALAESASMFLPTGATRVALARQAGEAMQFSQAETRPVLSPRAADVTPALHASRASTVQALHAAQGAASTLAPVRSAPSSPIPQPAAQPSALAGTQSAQAQTHALRGAAEVSATGVRSLETAPQAQPARQKLAVAATPDQGQANSPRAGAASLAEREAQAAQAMPEAVAMKLAQARPGRPVPVVTADGVTESVDYADNNPDFIYPRLAVRLGLEGTVVLLVDVLPDGRPGAVRIQHSSGHDVLDKDALRQLATWRFKPPQRLGRTHSTRVSVPINYRLNSKGRP